MAKKSIELTQDVYAKVSEVAKALGVSPSELVRRAIDKYEPPDTAGAREPRRPKPSPPTVTTSATTDASERQWIHKMDYTGTQPIRTTREIINVK